MNNRLLVDTNILIYAIDADSKFHQRAQSLILDSDFELVTTAKNITEFLVVLTRTAPINIDIVEALDILTGLLSHFRILYPSENSYTIFEELLRKYRPKGLKLHDFEIVSIGLAAGIDRIATQNKDDFKNIKEIKIEHL